MERQLADGSTTSVPAGCAKADLVVTEFNLALDCINSILEQVEAMANLTTTILAQVEALALATTMAPTISIFIDGVRTDYTRIK